MTGGLRIGKLHRRISKDKALGHMPTLRDRASRRPTSTTTRADDARLTLTIARTAAEHGAAVVNDAAVVGFDKDAGGRVQGVRVVVDGTEMLVRARTVVNATGVWSDNVRALDEGRDPDSIRPAKGVHITVPWAKVRNDIAAVIPVPKDRRSVFVVPWGDFTYIGTTDTDYDGPLDDPQCTPDDIAYLLRAINGAVTTPITESDILGTWAGLRPLVKRAGSERTADLSRRHSVTTSASGVVTVTGGKLTTYRRMAADTIDTVVKALGVKARSRTARLPLTGARDWGRAAGSSAHLASRYGSNGDAIRKLDRRAAGAGRADRARPRVLEGRGRLRRARRDGAHRRRRARPPHPRPPARARRVGRRGRRGGSAHRPDPRVERRRAEASTAAYRALVDAERTSAQLPETALDAALGA